MSERTHPSLKAAQAKLALATEHLQTFKTEVSRVEESSPYRLTVDFNAQSGWWVATADVSDEPGPDLGVLIGAIAYQCLSALNILVWELAARKVGSRRIHTDSIRRHVSIPVTVREQDFASLPLISKHWVSVPATAALRRLQPYAGPHGPSGPNEHPLRLLKEIADSDKHRVLVSHFFHTTMQGVSWAWDTAKARGPVVKVGILPNSGIIEHGVPVAAIRFDEGNEEANVKVDPQPSSQVRISTDSWVIRPPDVEMFWRWAVEAVEIKLAPLFPNR